MTMRHVSEKTASRSRRPYTDSLRSTSPIITRPRSADDWKYRTNGATERPTAGEVVGWHDDTIEDKEFGDEEHFVK